MQTDNMANQITPEVYSSFKRAIEIGKWPDGRKLSDEQKAICMQAIISYEHLHLPEEERTGYIPPKKTACSTDRNSEQSIKWK